MEGGKESGRGRGPMAEMREAGEAAHPAGVVPLRGAPHHRQDLLQLAPAPASSTSAAQPSPSLFCPSPPGALGQSNAGRAGAGGQTWSELKLAWRGDAQGQVASTLPVKRGCPASISSTTHPTPHTSTLSLPSSLPPQSTPAPNAAAARGKGGGAGARQRGGAHEQLRGAVPKRHALLLYSIRFMPLPTPPPPLSLPSPTRLTARQRKQ